MIPKNIINSVAEYLQLLFKIRQDKTSDIDKNDNSLYLSLAEDNDEYDDIKDLCEDVDNYYEERAKLKASRMKAYLYLEKRVIEMYKEENPNATDEDCAQFLEDIRNTLDNVITTNANVFSQEANDYGVDNSEQTESFFNVVEDKLARNEDFDLSELSENNGKEVKE